MTYLISTNKSLIDLSAVHDYLSNISYWAKGISKEQVQKSIEYSLCFGIYLDDRQVGFARVITDYVRVAYLADVFIVEEHKGKGLGKKLIKHIIEYEELQGVFKWMLVTKDAHGLYEPFGFTIMKEPDRCMEKIGNT